MLAHLLSGFVTGQSLIVAIGAQNAFVLRQGIRGEHRLPLALICALSDALLIGLGIAGLGALIQASPLLLSITRYGGAAFLLAYGGLAGWRAWRGEQLTLEASAPIARATAILTCLGLTYLNPHVYLDTVLLLGAIANQHGSDGRWLFGAGACLSSLAWFFLLAYGARYLRPWFQRPLAWRVLDCSICAVMWVSALGLLLI